MPLSPSVLAPPSQDPDLEDEGLLLGLAPGIWALGALIAGLLLTVAVAHRQWRNLGDDTETRRVAVADLSLRRLQAPLQGAATELRAMQSVYLANSDISQAQFSIIRDNLRADAIRSSHVITGFARRQAANGIDGGPHYLYERVAPLVGNEMLLGFDIARQPKNLRALMHARDNNQPVLSAPFALLQAPKRSDEAMGVVVRLPVYTDGLIPKTVAQRRYAEIGAMVISLRLRPLIHDALAGEALDLFRARVTDLEAGQPQLLYDSGAQVHGDARGYRRMLDFGGRRWQIDLQPRHAGLDTSSLWAIILSGVVGSLLLATLLWSLATTRRRAVTIGRQMGSRYRDSEGRFRTLNELLPALVLLAGCGDGRIRYANQAARLRLGSAIGADTTLPSLFLDPNLQEQLGTCPGAGQPLSNIEAILVSLNGDQFWANASISQVEMNGLDHYLMVATDISEQRQLTELLSYQATHDALTELYNRREFERRVEQALVAAKISGRASALFYIDLDQFKLINDTSGHIAGDQLLAQLALTMREQLRAGDVLARLGGDEFGLLAFHVDADAARVLAERMRQRIEGLMFVWQSRTYTVSASIGVVLIDRPDATLKDLLTWADTACYLAKEHGRNRIHVYTVDDETTRRLGEMEWANRLRWAIEEDRLLLDYQELVPLKAGLAEGPHIELLLRFRDEGGRVILPGAFLPAAERYGLMPAIDRWVIRTALANFGRLHASGAVPGTCAINLSGASIEDDDLVDYILALVREHAVPSSRLCFEITETVAVRSLLKVVHFIDRLRGEGCLVALDDFGAGMSSFGYLKNLPVDLIKIDGSFIRDFESDPMSRSIVHVIAEIGHQRGLEVVAEWVGSESLATALAAVGIDYGQGFALHRPERVVFQRLPADA